MTNSCPLTQTCPAGPVDPCFPVSMPLLTLCSGQQHQHQAGNGKQLHAVGKKACVFVRLCVWSGTRVRFVDACLSWQPFVRSFYGSAMGWPKSRWPSVDPKTASQAPIGRREMTRSLGKAAHHAQREATGASMHREVVPRELQAAACRQRGPVIWHRCHIAEDVGRHASASLPAV